MLDELTIELKTYNIKSNQFEGFFYYFLTKDLFLFKLFILIYDMGPFTNHVDRDGGGGFAKSPHLGVCECLSISEYFILVCISCLLISFSFYNYRDKFSDYLLAVIKDAMNLYPHLKLILMSATMNAQLFL